VADRRCCRDATPVKSLERVHIKNTGQSQGHFSEDSRSASKVVRHSVTGSEIPPPIVSFSSLYI